MVVSLSKTKRSTKKKQRTVTRTRANDLDGVNLNVADIDIGATEHYVAVSEDYCANNVKCFGTFTADLEKLADWLAKYNIKKVAMESTGVYWIPVFEILESRGFEVKLVEPGKLKHVPGRKTDVLDWHPHQHGVCPYVCSYIELTPGSLPLCRLYFNRGGSPSWLPIYWPWYGNNPRIPHFKVLKIYTK